MQSPFTIIIPILSKCTLEKEEEKDYVQNLKANENARERRSEMLYKIKGGEREVSMGAGIARTDNQTNTEC